MGQTNRALLAAILFIGYVSIFQSEIKRMVAKNLLFRLFLNRSDWFQSRSNNHCMAMEAFPDEVMVNRAGNPDDA